MYDTKEVISNAFLELAKEKNPDNITVTDICNRANVVRKTFYYYFEDKFDLFKWSYRNNLVKRIQSHLSEPTWKDIIEKSIIDAIESRELFTKIISKSSEEFSKILFDIQYEVYCEELVKTLPGGVLPQQIEAELYIFLKGGTEYMKYYFYKYNDTSYKKVSKLIVNSMPESLANMRNNSSK